jgi:ribosomal protein S18 acetylase RimI-like enzyme
MSWTIREGRIDEVDRLVALRCAMFEGMGHDDPEVLGRVAEASRKYFLENMPTGLFRVWVACALDADEPGTKRGASSDESGTCRGERTALIGLADSTDAPEGELIASIGLVVHSVPPGPSNPVGKAGYIMNLVTLPAWRRRGIARALLQHVLNVLRAEGVPVASLHASSDGHGLYEDLGFAVRDDLPEMRLRLG